MSTTIITIEEVKSVRPHPDADRLDVIEVLGYQVITGKGNVKVGDHVFYFPPDIMIPPRFSVPLGVQQYLKHARMSTDSLKIQCRVAACRLRGLPSYGFIVPCLGTITFPLPLVDPPLGMDVTKWFEGEKYEPPVRLGGGDAEPDMPNFHRYTSIENIQRRMMFREGEEVVFTEKIHGTNCRMGYVKDYGNGEGEGEMSYQSGSNKLRRKSGEGLYWSFFDQNVKDFLFSLSREELFSDVVLFGEIYGPGVQDMQYGETEKRFRAFDCTVNGIYVDKDVFCEDCEDFGIRTVPELYRGPFSLEKVAEYTDGMSTFSSTGKFRGREGIVITPMTERVDYRGNRVIAKSVSVDYLNRRGAEDNA